MKTVTILSVLALLAAPLARAEEAEAPAADAPAAAEGSLFLLGLRAGPTTPQLFNKLQTNGLLNLEGAWGPAKSGFALFFDVGYTQPEEHGTRPDARFAASGGNVAFAMKVQDLALGLGALYRIGLDGGFTPFVGVGGRMHLTKTTVEQHAGTTDLGTNVEQGMRFGMLARLGLAKTLGPGELGVEVHLDFAPVDHLVTGDRNTGFLGYQLSYLFAL